MNTLTEILGWSKSVLCERDDGAHEKLIALYFCRTLVEAVTLQGFRCPTHVKRGNEVLTRMSGVVYQADDGRMYVVFNWRDLDPFIVVLDE